MTTQRLATASCAVGMLTYVGLSSFLSVPDASAGTRGDFTPPPFIELTGVVRDFNERSHADGHPDFEKVPDRGYGLYNGNISPSVGADGKPIFVGGGHKVLGQWKDFAGRPICWALAERYPAPGDTAGTMMRAESTGGITSADSFKQWYRDEPGVNLSDLLTLTMVRQGDGTYVFDDELDPLYQALGGFFPIEDRLYGNSGGSPDRNFHFTFELHGTFVYYTGGRQIFKFIGDDDVWVFINGELVIDIGGVHASMEQYVDLNRLGLTDGQTYRLDFFFAERHRTQSNFRIVTNLALESVDPPTISALFD